MTKPAIKLPPRGERKPKRIKVRVKTGPRRSNKRVLTYHVYGKRPKRGDKVRIKGGMYTDRLCQVEWRWSLYRGATYLAKQSYPAEWT